MGEPDARIRDARAYFASLVAGQSGAPPDLRQRLERAFANTPRERFMGPPPWIANAGGWFDRGAISDPAGLYQNVLVVLDAERGVNNGEPFLHGQMIAALAPERGDRALHVGCGTGYYTAILAELAAPGQVTGYEIIPELAERARDALSAWRNADVEAASGGVALPAADIVYVSAGASRPAAAWLDALNPHGRLIFPLTGLDGSGAVLKVVRRESGFSAELLQHVQFIHCVGVREMEEAHKVDEALRGIHRSKTVVRSLRRSDIVDDDTLLAGGGWQLSARAID